MRTTYYIYIDWCGSELQLYLQSFVAAIWKLLKPIKTQVCEKMFHSLSTIRFSAASVQSISCGFGQTSSLLLLKKFKRPNM